VFLNEKSTGTSTSATPVGGAIAMLNPDIL
jgi:hypothetical protein